MTRTKKASFGWNVIAARIIFTSNVLSSPWRATFLYCTDGSCGDSRVSLQDDGHVAARGSQASTTTSKLICWRPLLLPYSAWFGWLGLFSLPLSRRTQEESRSSQTGGSPGPGKSFKLACSVPSCCLSAPAWCSLFVWFARLVFGTRSSLIHLHHWLHYFTRCLVYVTSLLWWIIVTFVSNHTCVLCPFCLNPYCLCKLS